MLTEALLIKLELLLERVNELAIEADSFTIPELLVCRVGIERCARSAGNSA